MGVFELWAACDQMYELFQWRISHRPDRQHSASEVEMEEMLWRHGQRRFSRFQPTK